MASKTPTGRASALRAPFGVWGQTQRRRNFLLGVWGGADVKIPTYIVSRAVEGAHASLLVYVPRMWPRGSSPASALWQDLKRALRGLRPSSWRLVISTFPKLSIPPGCICVRVGGEDRGRSLGDSRRSGVHGAEGRERAKSYLVSQSRISVAVGCLAVVSYMYGQCPASQKSTW